LNKDFDSIFLRLNKFKEKLLTNQCIDKDDCINIWLLIKKFNFCEFCRFFIFIGKCNSKKHECYLELENDFFSNNFDRDKFKTILFVPNNTCVTHDMIKEKINIFKLLYKEIYSKNAEIDYNNNKNNLRSLYLLEVRRRLDTVIVPTINDATENYSNTAIETSDDTSDVENDNDCEEDFVEQQNEYTQVDFDEQQNEDTQVDFDEQQNEVDFDEIEKIIEEMNRQTNLSELQCLEVKLEQEPLDCTSFPVQEVLDPDIFFGDNFEIDRSEFDQYFFNGFDENKLFV